MANPLQRREDILAAWENSDVTEEYIDAFIAGRVDDMNEADAASKRRLGHLYHHNKPTWQVDRHLLLPALYLILRVAIIFSTEEFITNVSEGNAPGVVCGILGGLFGTAATLSQWDDSRWPTAQAKLYSCLLSGVGFVFDLGWSIQKLASLSPDDRLKALSGLLTPVASFLLTHNNFRLFSKGLVSTGGHWRTFISCIRLLWHAEPDPDLAWVSLAGDVKAEGIERRTRQIFDEMRHSGAGAPGGGGPSGGGPGGGGPDGGGPSGGGPSGGGGGPSGPTPPGPDSQQHPPPPPSSRPIGHSADAPPAPAVGGSSSGRDGARSGADKTANTSSTVSDGSNPQRRPQRTRRRPQFLAEEYLNAPGSR